MREGVQQYVWSAREWAQALAVRRPVQVSDREGIEETPDTPDKTVERRFSEGIERSPTSE